MTPIPWRTGVNMREFAYYGTPVIDPGDPENRVELQEFQLAALRDIKCKLVRFYAAHRDFTTEQSIERVRVALRKIKQFGMQAVVCLDDSVRDSGCFVRGNDEIPKGPHGHYDKSYYVSKFYQRFYLPFVTALVSAFKDDPTVAIWELLNEAALHPQTPNPPVKSDADAFYEFAREVSGKIKAIAPNHLVSTGLACVRHVISFTDGHQNAVSQAVRLYALPTIDVVSIHLYAEDGVQEAQWRQEWDVAVARQVNKPFYLGEFGASPGRWEGDRVAYHQRQFETWRSGGAFAGLVWQYNESRKDLRISDGVSRMHGDFEGLKAVLASFGTDAGPMVFTPAVQPTDITPFSVTPGEEEAGTRFRVMRDGQPVYAAPDRSASQLAALTPGSVINVDPLSRQEQGGLVWWQVNGWVVERAATVMPGAPDAPLHPATPEKPKAPAGDKVRFRVVYGGGIFVRRDPSRPADNSNIIGDLSPGDLVNAYADSRTQTPDGIVWWRHDDGFVTGKRPQKVANGWSAEIGTGGEPVFMERLGGEEPGGGEPGPVEVETLYQNPDETAINVNALPQRDALFSSVPVSMADCFILQHYGSTKESFDSCRYKRFFQGLHPGIDFGIVNAKKDSGLVEVRAGVTGTVEKILTDSYTPRGVMVKTGPYLIIYGHMSPNNLAAWQGMAVTPDTLLGVIANGDDLKAYDASVPPNKRLGFWPHLHLEIRYTPVDPDRILNPLLFMARATRQSLIKNVAAGHFFRQDGLWTEWGSPLEQPVIKFGGDLIGPLTRAQGGCTD